MHSGVAMARCKRPAGVHPVAISSGRRCLRQQLAIFRQRHRCGQRRTDNQCQAQAGPEVIYIFAGGRHTRRHRSWVDDGNEPANSNDNDKRVSAGKPRRIGNPCYERGEISDVKFSNSWRVRIVVSLSQAWARPLSVSATSQRPLSGPSSTWRAMTSPLRRAFSITGMP